MIKLGFDLRGTHGNLTGFGRFCYVLVDALANAGNLPFEVVCFIDRNPVGIEKFDRLPFDVVHVPKNPGLNSVATLEWWEQKALPEHLRKHAVDVYYSGASVLPLQWSGKRMVQIHDLSFLVGPEWSTGNMNDHVERHFRASAYAADLVLTCSRNTLEDCVKFWNVPSEKLAVLYDAIDDVFKPIPNRHQDTPYVLSVGTVQPRKNYVQAVHDFSVHIQPHGLNYIIVGKLGWKHRQIADVLEQAPGVIHLQYVHDAMLVNLYNGCEACVLLSKYEGFGYPIAEANACGKPVIVADNSCLPEVGGEACVVSNHLTWDALQRAKAIPRDKCLENAARFTKEKQAAQFIEHVMEVAEADRKTWQIGSRIANVQAKPAVRIIADTTWITGEQAEQIKRYNQDIDITIEDYHDITPHQPGRLDHVTVHSMWKPAIPDGFLLTMHHLDAEYSGYDLRRVKDVCDRAGHIICVCTQARDFLAKQFGVPNDKMTVVPNGVDLERYVGPARQDIRQLYGLPKGKFIFGHVSSCHQRKGVMRMLEVFNVLALTHDDFAVCIVTGRTDGHSNKIQRQVAEIARGSGWLYILPLNSFTGQNYNRWPDLLKAFDWYVSPAHIEGGPMPMLQAMACAVPVIATDTGAAKDLYNGHNLMLVDSGDFFTAQFFPAVEKTLADKDRAKQIGIHGAESLRHRSMQAMAEGYGEVYNRMLPGVAVSEPFTSGAAYTTIVVMHELFCPYMQQDKEYGYWLFGTLLDRLNNTVVALPDTDDNDGLAGWLEKHDHTYMRGDADDLTARIVQAADEYPAGTYFRINGDALLYTPDVLENILYNNHRKRMADYTVVENMPAGMTVEVLDQVCIDKLRDMEYSAGDARPYNLLASRDDIKYNRTNFAGWFKRDQSGLAMMNELLQRYEIQQPALSEYENIKSWDDLLHWVSAFMAQKNIDRREAIMAGRNRAETPGPRKVLYINHVTDCGGAEYSLLLLMQSLDRDRYLPVLVVPDSEGELARKARDIGAVVHEANVLSRHGYVVTQEEMYDLGALQNICENEGISLIHGNSYRCSRCVSVLSAAAALPGVCHVRDVVLSAEEARGHMLAGNMRVVAVSDFIRHNVIACLPGYPVGRIVRIYNGVTEPGKPNRDIRQEYGIPPDAPVVGFVGMMYQWKGLDVLLDVAIEMCKHRDDVYFLLFGSAKVNKKLLSYYMGLQQRVYVSDYADRIIFPGFVEDKPAMYNAIDVQVVPSIKPDPFPRTTIEGMSYGKVVLGSQLGGIPEQLPQEYTYAPEDRMELFAKIFAVLNKPRLELQAMGDKLKTEAMEWFGQQRCAIETMATYDNVIGQTRR